MEDDPYRSLAGELRAIGGFAKDSSPFSEFLWADFLRPRIKPKAIKADFEGALAKALVMAKSARSRLSARLERTAHGYPPRAPDQTKGKKGKGKTAPRPAERPAPFSTGPYPASSRRRASS